MFHLVNHCLFHSKNLCFGSLHSVHMLYMISWSWLWLVACHFKNYFVITYLLEDEQELSLGMLIRLRRIYNFWCSMLDYISVPHVFIMFYIILACVSEKLYRKYSRNPLKIYSNYFQAETKTEPEERPEGEVPASIRPQAWPTPWLRLGPTSSAPSPPRVTPSPINHSRRKNPK